MNDSGTLFGCCLEDLDRDRKAIATLATRFSRVSDLIAACVRNGDADAAIVLLKRNRDAVLTLCGLARKAAEQEIALAVKLSELARSRGAGGDAAAALNTIERSVNAFVLSALDYLGEGRVADPGASSH